VTSNRAFLDRQLPVYVQETSAHNVERPIALPTSRLAQFLPKSNLLNIPCRRLDLDHIHMDDPLALIPYSLSTLVECPAFCTFEASFAGVKAGRCWVGGGTSQKEWIGLDCSVNGSFISVNVYLLVSSPWISKGEEHTGDRK
jgi:hypothetical protein